MSVEALTWAVDRDELPGGAKLLLLVIANSADHAGIAFPGRELLAKRCCCTPRAVTNQMRLLENRWEIARFERRRPNGSRTSDWIVLAPKIAHVGQGHDRSPMLDANEEDFPVDVIIAATSCEESSPDTRGNVQGKPVRAQGKRASRPEPSGEPSGDPVAKQTSSISLRDDSLEIGVGLP